MTSRIILFQFEPNVSWGATHARTPRPSSSHGSLLPPQPRTPTSTERPSDPGRPHAAMAAAAGGKRRVGGFFPLLMLLMGALMGGLLVAWRRLDAAQPPRPGLYEPQVFYDREDGGGGGIVRRSRSSSSGSALAADASAPASKTLVIYVYHESDAVTRENLEFFLAAGVGSEADPLVDYVLAVNGPASVALDALPPNVRVVRRENVCYDGGTAGEVLAGVDTRPYRFFIIMNSSVRGPFLPAYFAGSDSASSSAGGAGGQGGRRPWTTALTDLLNDRVKLAGTTISCEIRVHVQSMVLATDRVGLRVLWEAGTLDCARDREDAILRYELGASRQIMAAGYSIDCLMLRYRGVDWRAAAREHAACNVGKNPFVALNNDGLDTNPLEVLFVKVKPHTLASDHALQRWTAYALGRDTDLSKSHFHSPAVQRLLDGRRQRLERAVADCRAAFDHEGFAAMYPALARGSPQATYADFLREHLFAGHAFRYTVEEAGEGQLPFHFCAPFLRYGAPDLSG